MPAAHAPGRPPVDPPTPLANALAIYLQIPEARLVIADGGLPGWLVLGESGREFTFGAVGRFWTPIIIWRDVAQGEFAAFDEPGWGKIAANFVVTTQGAGTVLGYECRTATTDPVARRRFLRYWWLVRPFVGHIMRAALKSIKADAEWRYCGSSP